MSKVRLLAARFAWVAVVLLVAFNFAAVQTESAMDLHPHHHGGSDDHCCAGCHAGHFPVLDTAVSLQLGLSAESPWDAITEMRTPASNDDQTFNSSRAPPV